MTEAEKDAWIVQLRSDVVKYREAYRLTKYQLDATLNGTKFADGLRERHRKVIAGNSKRAFAEAVKLEKELKEYGNEKD